MPIKLEWDTIDNRNLALLRQIARDAIEPDVEKLGDGLLSAILYAMRRAGDEALFDRVSVRLERSFIADRSIGSASQEAIGWLQMESAIFQSEGKVENAKMATSTADLIASLQPRT